MNTKAFAYMRVSHRTQVDGDGFPRQLTAIRSYAQAHDYTLSHVYREEGVSGTTELENRPALQDLLTALYSNGVHTVIIEKLDRLARDLMVQETIIADFRKKGIELVSVAEPDLCSNDPSRVLVRQIFGAIAQYEKAMLVMKLAGARQRVKARDGRCEGDKPYGAHPKYPGEPEVIEQIRALRGQGMGLDSIAVRLNDEGVNSRRGVKWYPMTVSWVLQRAS
jgi:DNA invertase Pin-like site-specific DNA recombinase